MSHPQTKNVNEPNHALQTTQEIKRLRKQHEDQMGKQQWGEAENTARCALLVDPSSCIAYQLLFDAVICSNTPERFSLIIESAIQHAASRPRFASIRLALLGLPEEARQKLVESMYNKWPELRSSPVVSDLVISINSNHESIAQQALTLAEEQGRERAFEFLEDALNKAKSPAEKKRIKLNWENLSAIPSPQQLPRPLIELNGQEVSCSSDTNTGKVALFFSGIGRSIDLPLRYIDAFLAAEGYTTIFVGDKSFTLSMNGIQSLGPDFQTTNLELRKIIDSFNCDSLTVLGKSGGGFPALHYGIELGADRIITFSPPTCVSASFTDSVGDNRAPALNRRLQRAIPRDKLDIALTIEKRKPTCPIEIHFGNEQAIDRAHANHLGKFDNVSLYPMADYADHESMRQHMINGSLQTVLS